MRVLRFLEYGLKLVPALIIIFLAGCSSGSDDTILIINRESFSLDIPALYTTVDSIIVYVAYESDAAPFTGTVLNDTGCWELLQTNIAALFLGRVPEPDVFVPEDLSEMVEFATQDEQTWTATEIIDLAESIWEQEESSFSQEFFILYLNGYLDDEGEPNYSVLGVSIVDTPVIAVFKDVVLNSSSQMAVRRFVEQATLVHEFGHIMGLVDNGVPMVTDHLDPEHERHCINEDCVMYWLNEGASDLRDFAEQLISTDSAIMYCAECLDDTRGYIPAASVHYTTAPTDTCIRRDIPDQEPKIHRKALFSLSWRSDFGMLDCRGDLRCTGSG